MYSPKIREDLIRMLCQIGRKRRTPMTKVVDELLRPAVMEAHETIVQEETAFYDYDEKEVNPCLM